MVKHVGNIDFGMSILITNAVGTNAIGTKADRTNYVRAIVIGSNFVRKKAFRTNKCS